MCLLFLLGLDLSSYFNYVLQPILPTERNLAEAKHVHSSLEIEETLTNKHQFVVPGEKYPRVSEKNDKVMENISRFPKLENFISSGVLRRQIY